MSAPMHGQLEHAPPAALLRQLAGSRATGCLRIADGGAEARVWFRDGAIYTATAPEARARLGERLVGAGHLTEGQLRETLRLQRALSPPPRLGELLVERGLIDRQTLRTYVRQQIADSVTAALAWTHGRWTFRPGEQVLEDAPLRTSVENLLMEGARRLEDWEVVRSRLGSVDAVVDFAADSPAELSLTPDEWAMLTHIDGVSTVADIAAAAGYGQFEAGRLVYGLLSAGVLTLVEPAPRSDTVAPDVAPLSVELVLDESPAPPRVDRDDLLREFAALDADDPAVQRGAPPPRRPGPRHCAPRDDRMARLLDRFRKP